MTEISYDEALRKLQGKYSVAFLLKGESASLLFDEVETPFTSLEAAMGHFLTIQGAAMIRSDEREHDRVGVSPTLAAEGAESVETESGSDSNS